MNHTEIDQGYNAHAPEHGIVVGLGADGGHVDVGLDGAADVGRGGPDGRTDGAAGLVHTAQLACRRHRSNTPVNNGAKSDTSSYTIHIHTSVL